MSFWDCHGLLFLLGLMFIPRITLVFFGTVVGGPVFWSAILLFPRSMIVILAAATYWHTNPLLVFMSLCWMGLWAAFRNELLKNIGKNL